MVFPNIYIDNIYYNLEKEPKIYKLEMDIYFY